MYFKYFIFLPFSTYINFLKTFFIYFLILTNFNGIQIADSPEISQSLDFSVKAWWQSGQNAGQGVCRHHYYQKPP